MQRIHSLIRSHVLLCAIVFSALPLQPTRAQSQQQHQQPTQAQSAQPPSSGTLDRIRGSGRIALGYRADDPPMSYRDGNGQPAGFAVTICRKIAQELKAELQLQELAVDWTALIDAAGIQDVQLGKIDLLCSGEAVTLTQRASVSFSAPIFLGGIAAVVSRSSPAEFQHLLENKPPPYKPTWRGTVPPIMQHRKLAVISGTPAVAWLAERISSFKVTATISAEADYASALAKVASGEADALFGDRAQLLAATAKHPDAAQLKVLNRHFTYQPQAIALRRNDDDFRLAVDRVLAEGMASPKFGELYIATFGPPDADTIEFFRGTPR
jgi:polar amino acid transport system substrate-binding protein